MGLTIVPITFREACSFVAAHHRHHRPPQGMKFTVGVADGDQLVGVAIVGRPVARALDDGVTIEVTRTCTVGTSNANSILYGAAWRAARALGYRRLVTYIQDGESGASLRAAGLIPVAALRARPGWDTPGRRRDSHGVEGISRTRWEIRRQCEPRADDQRSNQMCSGAYESGGGAGRSRRFTCAAAVSAGTAGNGPTTDGP